MSDLYVSYFLNHDRPKIQHSDVTVSRYSIFTKDIYGAPRLILYLDTAYCHSLVSSLFKTTVEASLKVPISKLHNEGLEEWIKHTRVSIVEETEHQCLMFLFIFIFLELRDAYSGCIQV